jgi:peptide chain release factor subunit 1
MRPDLRERTTPLVELIDRLARFEPTGDPVISLYLNLQADQHGRDNFQTFLRKEMKDRLRTYSKSDAGSSLERDAERIHRYLDEELRPSANGLAIFACGAADGFFEAIQLEAPMDEHRLFIEPQPHVYPLARLDDQYPRYAALLVNTNSARLFVFSTGRLLAAETVQNTKTRHSSMGGWSQARFQRHVENYHLQHAKEVVAMLDEVVRRDNIPHVILAGDEVVIPLLRSELPPHLESRITDELHLDTKTPEHEVLRATLEALHERDARDDRERVARLFDAHRSGGLGTIGVEGTLGALEKGQVDELLITAAAGSGVNQPAGDQTGAGRLSETVAEELVRKARQTSAAVTFIEDPELLRQAEGVGARLRYR